MGIPSDWSQVEKWLDPATIPAHPGKEKEAEYTVKNTEIPELSTYRTCPDDSFWKTFPRKDTPQTASTRINVRNLEKLVNTNKDKLTVMELKRATRVVNDLRFGAEACQMSELPPMATVNNETSFKNGRQMTDKIATWVKEEIVAGPFDYPPMEKFRCNPLIAIERNGKVRPVINMSGPKGHSYNENLDKTKLEKVRMTTAKEFSFSLKEAGAGAIFSKFDIKDAYKLVPAKPQDYRLQGFKWLDKFFYETQQTFGAVTSVCNFDRLGNTIATLAAVTSDVPRKYVSRTLDDFQGIGGKDKDTAQRFAKGMKDVCGYINVPLAANCAKKEKAFELETRGTVLGTGFCSTDMTWFLSKEKVEKITRRCMDVRSQHHISLLQTQQLMGTVNDFSQLCRFTKFFRHSGNRLLSQFGTNENILIPVPDQLKKEIYW